MSYKDFLECDLHGIDFNVDALSNEFHAEGRDTIPAIISGLFERNAQGEGKVRWGDKTPYYVMHIPKLLEWFPGAQIIHLIRDGRDVALSLFGREHDFGVYNSYFAAEYWESYVEKGRAVGKKLSTQQYIELRYEDFLDKPEASMRTLCDFLGETYSEDLFDVDPVDDPGKTPLVHQPLNACNAAKWRRLMSPAQIKAFERVAGDTLRECGYPLSGSVRRPGVLTKMAYRLHNRLMIAYWRRVKSR